MRVALMLVALAWIAASAYYTVRGHRTRKEAIERIEGEREGRIVPEEVRAEARLPKSLEERLAKIVADGPPPEPGAAAAGGHASGSGDQPHAAPAADPGEVPPPPPPPPPGTSTGAAPDVPDATVPSIFDAAPEPIGPDASASGAAPTVAEALQGVALPHDLVPMVAAGAEAVDQFRMPFVTRGHAPTTIALGLRDAFDAADFEFRSTGPMTATATRDGATVHLQVFDVPSGVTENGVRRFPSVALDAIVVEIRTR